MDCSFVRTIIVTYFCKFRRYKSELQFLFVCNGANLPVFGCRKVSSDYDSSNPLCIFIVG